MASTEDSLLFIVGMHRSGTSALCAALNNYGINFGTGLLVAMAGVNDEGFWEDGEVVALNDSLLSQASHSWYSLGEAPGNIDWRDASYDEARTVAQQVIERGFGAVAGHLVGLRLNFKQVLPLDDLVPFFHYQVYNFARYIGRDGYLGFWLYFSIGDDDFYYLPFNALFSGHFQETFITEPALLFSYSQHNNQHNCCNSYDEK